MRKYIYNVFIILFVLQMSHVQVFANYEQKNTTTANSIESLQDQIQKQVMQLTTEFDIRYTGKTTEIKDELSELIKHAIQDPYIYANISSFKWKYEGYTNNIVIRFEFTYHISQQEEVFVEQTLANIIAPMHGLSELQKIQAAHDFIVLSAEYSKETEGSPYSPYTLLTEKKGVCQAYALVLYRMLEMQGFEVQYVPGKVGEQLHAWVLVKLDNAWYHIDVTWDDPLPDHKGEVRYNYFLVSDRQLAKDHSWDYSSFSAATSEAYSDLQKTSKVEVLTKPIMDSQFTFDKGLSVLSKNKLLVKPLIEQPTLFLKGNKSDKSVQVHLNEWEPIILESNIAELKANRKIILYKKKGLRSIDRTEKRMPQEKYVIIKEVSPYDFRGTSLLIYLCSFKAVFKV
ncbi:S-layer protein [Lysinibacillus sphaericus]|uniref:transglutaminase domain-containing protein n=1 Tax=Lysinibacillus sphaericus TaxID=1421 RepID=UPI0018CD4F7B|nr:transglutaminase domain-containing protein [Lysinibacillus sphaericus]MBG9454315.1 S-layer protein [Lysinibacillus sphaericus]MBG9476447.1 S-layer protein [Lysinibacillus sphaericus]MBG9591233.1 S-layer protein [Lysinibacillus sphaericus]